MMARLVGENARSEDRAAERLKVLEAEIHSLSQNMLQGIISATLAKMLAEREAEQAALKARLDGAAPGTSAEILPHPVLLKRFEEKIVDLRAALNDESIRTEGSEVIGQLIESVTIYPDGEDGPEAEVAARTEALMAFATNENSPPIGNRGAVL